MMSGSSRVDARAAPLGQSVAGAGRRSRSRPDGVSPARILAERRPPPRERPCTVAQRLFDLAELDAVAANLHLMIEPAEELERAVRPVAHADRRCGTSGRRPRPNGSATNRSAVSSGRVAVAARHAVAADVELAGARRSARAARPRSRTYSCVLAIGRPIGTASRRAVERVRSTTRPSSRSARTCWSRAPVDSRRRSRGERGRAAPRRRPACGAGRASAGAPPDRRRSIDGHRRRALEVRHAVAGDQLPAIGRARRRRRGRAGDAVRRQLAASAFEMTPASLSVGRSATPKSIRQAISSTPIAAQPRRSSRRTCRACRTGRWSRSSARTRGRAARRAPRRDSSADERRLRRGRGAGLLLERRERPGVLLDQVDRAAEILLHRLADDLAHPRRRVADEGVQHQRDVRRAGMPGLAPRVAIDARASRRPPRRSGRAGGSARWRRLRPPAGTSPDCRRS